MRGGGKMTRGGAFRVLSSFFLPSSLPPSLCTSDCLQGETVLMKRRWRHHCSGHLIELFAHSDLDRGPEGKKERGAQGGGRDG